MKEEKRKRRSRVQLCIYNYVKNIAVKTMIMLMLESMGAFFHGAGEAFCFCDRVNIFLQLDWKDRESLLNSLQGKKMQFYYQGDLKEARVRRHPAGTFRD